MKLQNLVLLAGVLFIYFAAVAGVGWAVGAFRDDLRRRRALV